MPNPAPTTLLHFDGDDASTTFTDSASSPHTWTAVGNAQLDTAAPKFGSACLLLDGTGDYVNGDGSSDFAFGTGDFTIEFWFYRAASGVTHFLFDGRSSDTDTTRCAIYVASSNVVRFHMNNATRISTSGISTSTWYHVSVNRLSGVTKLYLDGVADETEYTDTNNYDTVASRPRIGANGVAAGPFNGKIDDFLIIKGTALRTGNFTAPTGPYDPDAGSATGNMFMMF